MSAVNCLFCSIIAGQIPCAKIYEDQHVLAFLDINPIAPGHALVLPKAHYPTLLDLAPGQGEALMYALQKVGGAVQKATNAPGFNVMQNNFSAAGQVIFHLHFHVIPRFENDGLPDWAGKPYADNAAMQRMAQAIASIL